ncbi:MAG: hypothetical protein ACYDCQ_09495 [Dehalococcoidia bacterium]
MKKAAAAADNTSLPFDLSLPDSLRLDRYGRAFAGSMPDFVHRLPSADEARGSIVSTAQRALHAMPEVSIPGRRPRPRRRNKLMLVAGFVGIAAGAYLLYRRFAQHGADEDEWSSSAVNADWPATPSTGDTKQSHESDAQAELDAEATVDVLGQTGAPAPAAASASGNGAQATS